MEVGEIKGLCPIFRNSLKAEAATFTKAYGHLRIMHINVLDDVIVEPLQR